MKKSYKTKNLAISKNFYLKKYSIYYIVNKREDGL